MDQAFVKGVNVDTLLMEHNIYLFSIITLDSNVTNTPPRLLKKLIPRYIASSAIVPNVFSSTFQHDKLGLRMLLILPLMNFPLLHPLHHCGAIRPLYIYKTQGRGRPS